MKKYLTKLKKRERYGFWSKVPSQAVQNITERIDDGYKKFFKYATKKTKLKSSPPTFKSVRKYKGMITLLTLRDKTEIQSPLFHLENLSMYYK